MDRDALLKKNIIGGFNKKDVMDYINRLRKETSDRYVRGEIDDMRLRAAALREILKEKDKQIAILNQKIDNINSIELPAENSDSDFEMLRRSSSHIQDDEITSQISADIKEKEAKISSLLERLSSINDEITRFNESISQLSGKIKDVPFEPVTEEDVDSEEMPGFDFDKVMEAIAFEEKRLSETAAEKSRIEADRRNEKIKAEIEARLHNEEKTSG